MTPAHSLQINFAEVFLLAYSLETITHIAYKRQACINSNIKILLIWKWFIFNII